MCCNTEGWLALLAVKGRETAEGSEACPCVVNTCMLWQWSRKTEGDRGDHDDGIGNTGMEGTCLSAVLCTWLVATCETKSLNL